MDGTGLLIRPFGGEDRAFCIDIDRMRPLQLKTDCGPVELIRRMEAGTWRVDDLRETIFQGLVGAGASQVAATALVQQNFDNQKRGISQFVPLAHDILLAFVFGPEDDPLGEPKAGAKTRTRSRVEKSGSAKS